MNLLVVYLQKINNNTMIKYVEAEVEVEIEDVLDYIEYANQSEIDKIKDKISYIEREDPEFPTNNLYDREKVLILKEAMKRYNLDQLIEKLGINPDEAM